MARKLNVGLIGVGVIGVKQLESFLECKDVEVLAVADVKEDVARSVATEYDIPNVFTDYRELLDVDGLDAVSVCTPPFAHAEPTCAAAAAGKHVLCEKPMAMSVQEARDMVSACREAGVKLGICHARSRFSPRAEAMRRYVTSGFLGDVYYARISRFRRRGRPGLDILVDSRWFLDSSKAGGGCLMDIGCYDIDLMLYVLDSPKPVSVAAMTFQGVGAPAPAGVVHDVEDQATVFVRFEGGLTVTFEQSFAANMANADDIRIFGTKAGLAGDPLELYTEQEGQQVKIVPDLPQQSRGAPQPLIADFVAACLEDREPRTHGEDGLTVTRIMRAAYASAEQGREVTIEAAASA
ncbi:MAG: Gfo/Idh/MocA family oxidoreductase [Armatimonadota bacterium]|jgi:predicted dehydrogenase